MKRLKFLVIAGLLTMSIALALPKSGYAQSYAYPYEHYEIERGIVYYHDEPMEYAEAATFIELGWGYAKDRYNVYLNGDILEHVDPATFRLKGFGYAPRRGNGDFEQHRSGYFKTTWDVYYNGRKLDANSNSFVELGGGYAKDAFSVFYRGMKIQGAMAGTFKYLGDGYAEDAFDSYFRGKKMGK